MRGRGAGVLIATLAFVFAFIVFGVPVAPVSPCGDGDTYGITMADGHQIYMNIIYKSKYPPNYCQTGTEEPPTPLIIHGFVFYENKTECNNPIVNITNLKTGGKWMAETHSDSNYYLLMLVHGRDVNASEVLRFDVSSPDKTRTNTTEYTVTQDDINAGGLFNFNITLGIHDINITTDYKDAVNGIKITRDGTDVVGPDENLTIGKTYKIRYKLVNEGDFNETVHVTVRVANESWSMLIGEHNYSLDAGKSNTYYDKWNTSGLAPGNYIITVNASISNDAHPEDNERTRDVILESVWTPWIYDENGNGTIDREEAVHAVQDYFADKITRDQVIEVLKLYFG